MKLFSEHHQTQGLSVTLRFRHTVISPYPRFHIAAFLVPDQVLPDMDKIAQLPGIIVHGRYDVICPLDNAWALHEAWTNSELQIIREAGHSASEHGICDALVRAAADIAQRLLALPPEEA